MEKEQNAEDIVTEDQQASRYLTAPPNSLENIKIKTKVRIRIHLMTKWCVCWQRYGNTEALMHWH